MELVADINLDVLVLPQDGQASTASCSITSTSPVRPQSLQTISNIGMTQSPCEIFEKRPFLPNFGVRLKI
jgi:hypothetical protein